MSKMSQMHAELTQEAYENGFETLEEYLADQERTKAHEAWLKEREEVIRELKLTLTEMGSDKNDTTVYYNRIARALKFIEEGEM